MAILTPRTPTAAATDLSLTRLHGPADLSTPTPVDAEELRKRIAAGEWVVDLRDRTAYAAEHRSGSVGIERGQQFSTYLGWLMPWGSTLTPDRRVPGTGRRRAAAADPDRDRPARRSRRRYP
jgi:hypothetical protein